MKGKKTRLGTPHAGETPEARAAESLKSNKQRYHLSTGDASTELSETQNESPEQRAASRGVKNAPKKNSRPTTGIKKNSGKDADRRRPVAGQSPGST